MYLPAIDLYELGQYLRIVLWICVPLIIISLLVTTWLHYRRRLLDPGWQLSIEGLDNPMEPERVSNHLPDDSLSYRERYPDEQTASDEQTAHYPDTGHGPDKPNQRIPADNDQWGKESVSQWRGKDNIYQGILWMKDKYEQYRDQTDQKYELLKEELKRSERRYQDLLDGKPDAAAMTTLKIQYNQARQQLEARQLIIDELEEQLRIERLKVEELVGKLQSNSQLLLNIYEELDKSVREKSPQQE
jgi:hypothetical protein